MCDEVKLRGIGNPLPLLLCIAVASCSSASLRSDKITGSFEANIRNLDLNNSFAFYQGTDEFYFSRVLLSAGDDECRFFIGFKNGQFRYSFPAFRLAELSKIYYEKYPLQKKKDLALKKIEDFEVEDQKCTKEIAEREKTAAESVGDATYLVLFAPLLPLSLVFGADVWIKSVKDSILKNKMDQLRLGMTMTQVRKLLGKELIKSQISPYEYYSLDYGEYQRLVMVFENDHLTGMIRGLRDRYEHKK